MPKLLCFSYRLAHMLINMLWKILLRHFVPNFASHPQVARIPVIAPVLAMIAKEFGVALLNF